MDSTHRNGLLAVVVVGAICFVALLLPGHKSRQQQAAAQTISRATKRPSVKTVTTPTVPKHRKVATEQEGEAPSTTAIEQLKRKASDFLQAYYLVEPS
jgi:FtsZ-interacting cell division protein ZipA